MTGKPPACPRQRLRLCYAKDEVLMFTGHLDLLRLILRWLRRAEAPFATSGKFSPKARLTFGPVLPLGVLGEAELLDLELAESVWLDADALGALLGRIQEVSAPRRFALGLRQLDAHTLPISRSAALAQYLLEYAEAGQAARALQALTEGDLTYEAKSGQRRDEREAIRSLTQAGQCVEVTGHCAGQAQLNIIRLGRAAAALTGTAPVLHRRLALLDHSGLPLV